MSRSTVEVRRAELGDAAALEALVDVVHRLRAEVLGRRPAPDDIALARTRERLVAVLHRPDVDVLVAWAGSRPVGLATVRRGELLPMSGDDALHVEQLGVHPEWRRRGGAAQLLAATVSAAEAAGCADVVCSAPAGHREAHRFLARLGFLPAVTHRIAPTAALRRRLDRRTGDARRGPVREVLVRRRRERERTVPAAAVPSPSAPAEPVG